MYRRDIAWFICCLSLLLVFAGGQAVASNSSPDSFVEAEYQLFLPVTVNRFPLKTTFGMQMALYEVDEGYSYLEDLQSSFIRYGLEWDAVEPIQGDRLWSELATLEDGLLRASQARLQSLLIIHGTPIWGRTIENAKCSRIRTEYLDAFGDFLYDAVRRYSYPPYNVMYWEIWNEPDIGYSEDLADALFGCWADYSDETWGGEYYAEVLQAVYPRIKAANPRAQVIIGGLHLDCDPRPEGNYCAKNGHNEHAPLYLTGILRAGGGDYFDGVGFHAYDYFHYWLPELGRYSNYHWGSGWDTSGPVLNAKASYIRQVLDEFGVSGKFLMNTEGSLICGPIDDWDFDEGCESAEDSLYEQTKARYVTQLYASAIASDLRANVWYNMFGYRHAELVDQHDFSLRPAYFSYRFARQLLADASFQREIEMDTQVRIYEFQVEGRQIWVVWSLNGENRAIALDEMPNIMYDYMGNALTPTNPLMVSLDPLYLVWTP